LVIASFRDNQQAKVSAQGAMRLLVVGSPIKPSCITLFQSFAFQVILPQPEVNGKPRHNLLQQLTIAVGTLKVASDR
jgi:hypothetical protein